MHGIFDCSGENRQLLVDLDADRLKDALGRMSALCTHLLRHGTVNDGNELSRRLDGMGLSGLLDECGNALCPALLAVAVEDLRQRIGGVLIDDRARAKRMPSTDETPSATRMSRK